MREYLGSFWCDHCSGEMRRPVWLIDGGTRVCADHYRAIIGEPPPELGGCGDEPPAAADASWTRLVHGLRMRPAPAAQHGIELQAVRQVQLAAGPRTVGDRPPWTLADRDLVELVLLASAYRDADEPTKALVRVQLFRVLHGTERP